MSAPLAGHHGQLICASLSHIHYWYEVGMLKVPAVLENEQAGAGRNG